MTARSVLLRGIADHIRGWNVSTRLASRRLGLPIPAVTAISAGKINEFSLLDLFHIAGYAGLEIHISLTDREAAQKS